MTLNQVIEALVFASPKPLLTKEIVAALRSAGEGTENQEAIDFAKTTEEQAVVVLEELKVWYETSGHSFALVEQVNGWTLVTAGGAGHWVRQLYPEAKPTRLSGPALETLAIIAYRQPVTRADIEAVRGVAVDGVMQVLLDRSLVKIAGRSEAPGRPLLYSTTEYFLQHFGLKTVTDLPNSEELRRVPLPTPPAPEGEAKAKEKEKDKEAAVVATEAPAAAVAAGSAEVAATGSADALAGAPAADAPAAVEEEPSTETPGKTPVEQDEPAVEAAEAAPVEVEPETEPETAAEAPEPAEEEPQPEAAPEPAEEPEAAEEEVEYYDPDPIEDPEAEPPPAPEE